MSQTLAQRYDAVPFPSLPVARAQPDFLATVARLRGLQPASPASARVLDLGCGGGQNLLPWAERYPEARFLGVDFSGVQIASGQSLAAELGLANVEFRHTDILDLDASLGTFDYIIAHGLYSWVEPPVRERLLALCQEHLAPHGVALVSYKTYPGWHLHDMIRHMMQYDATGATTPSETLNRGRKFLDFLTDCFTSELTYDQFVRGEAQALSQLSDAYLWHDHLAPVSHPEYFETFMHEAQRHKLQYLGEGTLGIRPNDVLDAESEFQLAALTDDPLLREQLRDLLHNRTLRYALLCHAEVPLNTNLGSDSLTGMYLSAALVPAEPPLNLKSEKVEHLTAPNGARVGTPVPLSKAALMHLGEIWPATIETDELVQIARQRVEQSGDAAHATPEKLLRLRDNLLQCCLAQIVGLHTEPAAYVAQVSEHPLATPLARWQASRTDLVTNRRHEPVRLEDFERHLLTMLDGQQDEAQLLQGVLGLAQSGRLAITDREHRPQTGDAARAALAAAVPATLQRLAQLAFLVG